MLNRISAAVLGGLITLIGTFSGPPVLGQTVEILGNDSGASQIAGCFIGNTIEAQTFSLDFGDGLGLALANGNTITVEVPFEWDFGPDVDPACYNLASLFVFADLISNATTLSPYLTVTVDADGPVNLNAVAGSTVFTYDFTVDVPDNTVVNVDELFEVEIDLGIGPVPVNNVLISP